MNRLTRFAGLPWIASLALLAGSGRAETLFEDPYGVGAPDVLGDPANFDIRSLDVQEIDGFSLQILIQLNYDGGNISPLAPFTVAGSSFSAVPVALGDVLIQGRSTLWDVPLSAGAGGVSIGGYSISQPVPVGEPLTRIAFFPGSLYRVTQTLTAGQVLGVAPAPDLRADEVVWGLIDHAQPDFLGNVPIAYSLGGSEIAIQLQVATGADFSSDVSDGYSVHFASTTCACDVLDGSVPEPSALALLAIALAFVPARRRLALGGGPRGREPV
ncbi:MAG: PEP-CTERM sorting domain-containing protein [Myxococcota bacterium]